MARVPALSLIVALVAACRATPLTTSEPHTVVVGAPSAPVVSLPAVPAPVVVRERLVVTRDHPDYQLWSVTAAGKPKKLAWPEGAVHTIGRVGAGSDLPLPSPDAKRVAYVRDGARKGPVVVRHLASETSTKIDAPPRSEVFVTGWSSDGRRLLFAAAPIDGPNGADANPDASDLFFFLHDVVSQRTERTAIPPECEYQAWLPSGQLLVICKSGSVLGRLRGNALDVIATKHQRFSQASASESGAIAVIADNAVLLLAAETLAEHIGPSGSWADYQWPKPSPSGRRVAYSHRSDLEVEGKVVASDIYDFEWLDEDKLVVLRSKAAPSVVQLM